MSEHDGREPCRDEVVKLEALISQAKSNVLARATKAGGTFSTEEMMREAVVLATCTSVQDDGVERVALMEAETALSHASSTFYRYARLHREKGTEDGDAKACANASMGEEMNAALATVRAAVTTLSTRPTTHIACFEQAALIDELCSYRGGDVEYRALMDRAVNMLVTVSSREAEMRAALDRAAVMSGLVAGDFLSPPQPPIAGEGKAILEVAPKGAVGGEEVKTIARIIEPGTWEAIDASRNGGPPVAPGAGFASLHTAKRIVTALTKPAALPKEGEELVRAVYDALLKEARGSSPHYSLSAIRLILTTAATLSSLPVSGEVDDPDLGHIGAGHVCKHGIRWPHACQPCDEAAWEIEAARRAALNPQLQEDKNT